MLTTQEPAMLMTQAPPLRTMRDPLMLMAQTPTTAQMTMVQMTMVQMTMVQMTMVQMTMVQMTTIPQVPLVLLAGLSIALAVVHTVPFLVMATVTMGPGTSTSTAITSNGMPVIVRT
jgi:hypothetical protein